jgi:hypothetical protein
MDNVSPQMLMSMMKSMGISPEMLNDRNRQGGPTSSGRPPVMHPQLSEGEFKQRMQDFEAWLAEDRRLGPEKPTFMERSTLIYQYEGGRATQLHHLRHADASGEVSMRTTFVGYEKHSSRVPLERLTRGEVASAISLALDVEYVGQLH